MNGLLLSILVDLSGIRKPFKDASIYVEMTSKLLTIIASAAAKDTADISPIAQYCAKSVEEEVGKLGKELARNLPSPPTSGLNSSSNEACKSRTDRKSRKKSNTCQNICVFTGQRNVVIERTVEEGVENVRVLYDEQCCPRQSK